MAFPVPLENDVHEPWSWAHQRMLLLPLLSGCISEPWDDRHPSIGMYRARPWFEKIAQATILKVTNQTSWAMQGMSIDETSLSPEDLRAFQQGLASGELGSLLPPWQPWWLSTAAARLNLTPGGTRAVEPIGTLLGHDAPLETMHHGRDHWGQQPPTR